MTQYQIKSSSPQTKCNAKTLKQYRLKSFAQAIVPQQASLTSNFHQQYCLVHNLPVLTLYFLWSFIDVFEYHIFFPLDLQFL